MDKERKEDYSFGRNVAAGIFLPLIITGYSYNICMDYLEEKKFREETSQERSRDYEKLEIIDKLTNNEKNKNYD